MKSDCIMKSNCILNRKNIYLVSIVFVTFVCIMIFSITLKTDAKENNGSREKYYTSVLIEEGDSLWSIAEKYKPDESISVKKYIKDLKRMNNMESDIIHSGNYLTIYYYQD